MIRYVIVSAMFLTTGLLIYNLGQKQCRTEMLTARQELKENVQVENPVFMPVLMPAVLLCLSSCAAEPSEPVCSCPVYPVAGPEVARELEQADYASYPHTWEWIGRINKLRQELELCSRSKSAAR